MLFLRNLPRKKKEEALEIYDKAFKKNKKTMEPKLAHKEARNKLQTYISQEFARKRDK